MKLKNLFFIILAIGLVFNSASFAGWVCVKTYTNCIFPAKLIGGECLTCLGKTDAGGKCYIASGTVFKDNVGAIIFPTDIYED